ncbi:MAG: metal-dependent transcriptional regulator [Candidatus Lokiarchaeota archaeon]|nr:metal-dependent transcriptional regulator [Candidatus Lokiarchaeota archaeon]
MRKKTIEDYLEIIYILEKKEGYAHTGKIADLLNIKAPSVSEMLAKLENEKMITYQPYKGAKLTNKGQKIAENTIQKHQTISEFLTMIGVEKHRAEVDACRLEHHISNQAMEKLIKFLDFIKAAPIRPMWLQRFDKYLETGERPECQSCIDESNQ